MSDKNKQQFGVWMDSQHATIVGRENVENGDFVVLGHVKNSGTGSNSSEKTSNNHEITLTHKFFKEIAVFMPNIESIHVTGTGQIQEEFINYLSETPQYKNAKADESTSNKMSDESLVTYISNHFS